jgi:DNA replication protein DnaC
MMPVTRGTLHSAGIPERYWKVSLSKLEESDAKKKLIKYLVTVHKRIAEGQGLFLYGGFETGKTSAGIAILKETIRRGGSVYFLRARHLLRAIYDNEETPDGLDLVRKRLREVDLLMLDDLGAEGFDSKNMGGAELEGVFRDRYDRNLPILVTSNYAPEKLKTKYTEGIVNIIRRTVTVIQIKTAQWKAS